MIEINEEISVRCDDTGRPTVRLIGTMHHLKGGHAKGCSLLVLAAFVQRLQSTPLPEGWEWVPCFTDHGLSASPVHTSGAGFYGHRNGNYMTLTVPGIVYSSADAPDAPPRAL